MQQHVLIIENGEGNLELIAKLVRRAGLTPVGATSLTEGKARFSQNMPETFLCAIVAYSLPDAPKGEAIDFTVESFIPTIATTESLDSAIRDKILERDVVDYIPKENSNDQLLSFGVPLSTFLLFAPLRSASIQWCVLVHGRIRNTNFPGVRDPTLP